MTEIRDAVILITGAGGGFGQQLIRQCLSAGGRLVLSDYNRPLLESAVETICREVSGGEVLQLITSDLSSAAGCDALYEAASHAPDILINNAGVGQYGRFDEIPVDAWERLMQINLLSPMRLVSRFLPDMIERKRGHIVNIVSVAGWVGTPGLASYSASKYGLRGFGEALHEELAPYNIRITNVYPFYSKTPILDSPKYGSLYAPELPSEMTTDPAEVIREVVQGILKNRLHVFPDSTAKQVHWLKRLMPGLLPVLNRRLLRDGQ